MNVYGKIDAGDVKVYKLQHPGIGAPAKGSFDVGDEMQIQEMSPYKPLSRDGWKTVRLENIDKWAASKKDLYIFKLV